MTRAEYMAVAPMGLMAWQKFVRRAFRFAPRQLVVSWACAVAGSALELFGKRFLDDARPRGAIETSRAWTRGEATIEQVRTAATAADAAYAAYAANGAAYAVHAAYAVNAAYGAANTAYAANGAAAAARVAANAANAAAAAANAAARAGVGTGANAANGVAADDAAAAAANVANANLFRRLVPWDSKPHTAWSWENEVAGGEYGAVKAGDYILLLHNRVPQHTVLLKRGVTYAQYAHEWQVLIDEVLQGTSSLGVPSRPSLMDRLRAAR